MIIHNYATVSLYNNAPLDLLIFIMTIENATPFFAWDVSSFLALFLVLTFVIVVIDQLFFNHAQMPVTGKVQKPTLGKFIYFALFLRFNKSEKYLNRPKIVQWSAEFFPVLLLVFMLRGFVIEPFRIPSNSMMPTLLTGDFILVSKFNYGVSIPILNKKVIGFSKPERGDVVVFRYPNYEKNSKYQGADFIKRIIGIPDDKIIYYADNLYVNGTKIINKNIGTYQGVESGSAMTGFKHKRELLDNNFYNILLAPNHHSKSVKLTVPKGHYFVMGDNRARSNDSRFWGFVPESYIIGKAFSIWMHWDKSLKLDRIGGFN